MSNFALRLLFQDVKDRFAAEGPNANVVFGKREPPKQTNQHPGGASRVVFVPGDPAGKAGKYTGPKIARAPLGQHRRRALVTMLELVTIYCWGVDTAAPNDEAAQYEAARALHDYVVRAVYLSTNLGHGSFTLSAPTWVQRTTERKFGAELFFLLEIEARIPDEPPDQQDTRVIPVEGDGTNEIAVDTSVDPVLYESDGTDHVPPES